MYVGGGVGECKLELVLRLALDEREETVSVAARTYVSLSCVSVVRLRAAFRFRFVVLAFVDAVDAPGEDRALACGALMILGSVESL